MNSGRYVVKIPKDTLINNSEFFLIFWFRKKFKMWFYEEGEIEPISLQPDMACAKASGLWLVSGPSDPAPMPMAVADPNADRAVASGGGGKRRKRADDGAAPATSLKAVAVAERPNSGNICCDRGSDDAEGAIFALPALRDIVVRAPSSPHLSSAASSSSSSSSSSSNLPEAATVRLALVGATGLVGRACATYLGQHPELGYEVTHYIGSALSRNRPLADVADEKEGKLRAHYGDVSLLAARNIVKALSYAISRRQTLGNNHTIICSAFLNPSASLINMNCVFPHFCCTHSEKHSFYGYNSRHFGTATSTYPWRHCAALPCAMYVLLRNNRPKNITHCEGPSILGIRPS